MTKNKKKLLELRKKIKSKKPDFVRQDVNKLSRLKTKWRKPKGYHSKLKLKKGGQKLVSPGYGSPKEVKGLHKSGLRPVRVFNLDDLDSIDKKTEGIVIGSSVGTKKRIAVIKKALEKKIEILNIKEPEKYVSEKEKEFTKRKKQKEKEEKKKQKESKEVKKESIEDKLTDEEKKKMGKKEIDRLLTKKF
ncbi:50S ribosomal protein L32e [Candidatus Woesearchaeota archaeon]|nr:50S ribosomal protein L32e [Candidatus Woesearchaeota archaeon]